MSERFDKGLATIKQYVTDEEAAPQIKTHITRGLHAGLTPKEIVEALLQLVPYMGFPRVQNALTIAQQVFTERQVTV